VQYLRSDDSAGPAASPDKEAGQGETRQGDAKQVVSMSSFKKRKSTEQP